MDKTFDRHTVQAADRLVDAVEDYLASSNWLERRLNKARVDAAIAGYRLSRISRLSRVDL